LRYLVVFGNEQLNLGQLDEAQRTFARAHDIDPTSAEPLAGLADAALRRGDVAAARAYLRQGRALDPASDAVRRVAARLGA
jgi:Flp pilus assembly protein TadD